MYSPFRTSSQTDTFSPPPPFLSIPLLLLPPLHPSQSRGNTTYTPSPDNWRSLPAYTVILDRFSDGEPSNNDFYGLLYEWAPEQTQMRYGGDIAGLNDSRALDYLEGMGIRTIYIAGTPWLNMPWGSDGESPSCS